MHPLVKKIETHLLAVFIIGVTVCFQPEDIFPTFEKADVKKINDKRHRPLAEITQRVVEVTDENGNSFQMRQLNGTQYPLLVKKAMRDAEILICQEYSYAGEQWYEWCTEEAGQWILYRWEKGQTTLRRVI